MLILSGIFSFEVKDVVVVMIVAWRYASAGIAVSIAPLLLKYV